MRQCSLTIVVRVHTFLFLPDPFSPYSCQWNSKFIMHFEFIFCWYRLYLSYVLFINVLCSIESFISFSFHLYELYSIHFTSSIILHTFIHVCSIWFINYIIICLCMTLFAQIFSYNSRSCLFCFFLNWLIKSLESCNWNMKFITHFPFIFCWYRL